MNNLIFIFETYTNGYISNVLDILSLFAILSGIFVIINKNPIISILFLIGLFASISSYLIILGFSFIGLSYLIVYIGAVSILFLFILMLINIRISELQSNTSNSIALSIIIIILFNYSLFQLLPYDIAILNNSNISLGETNNGPYSIFFTAPLNNLLYNVNFNKSLGLNNHFNTFSFNNDIFLVTSKLWDGNLAETNHISAIGNIMYTNYNIWLILASFILLLAMVGAIVITIKQKD